MHRSRAPWLIPFVILSGCATHTPIACPEARPGSVRNERVLFATDRKETPEAPRGGTAGVLDFGPTRTEPGMLQLGWETVQIRGTHHRGVIDSALSIAPGGRVVAGAPRQTSVQSDLEIFSSVTATVRAAIRASPAPHLGERRQVLLFIHGYNDTFGYSILKAGQLAADLDLLSCEGQTRGVPIAYSWPAQGKFLSYLADEENAEWTQQRFVTFLRALAAVTQEERADLSIIAHSMGARLLVRSLAEIASSGNVGGNGPGRPLFGQIVLLAPDIARDLFNQYAERALPIIGHLTVYASEKDRALALSSLLHGGHRRLGLVESALAIPTGIIESAIEAPGRILESAVDSTEGQAGAGRSPNATANPRALAAAAGQTAASRAKIDVIDVTGGITDFTGHSYEDPHFIADLKTLIHEHRAADQRPNLVRQQNAGIFGPAGPRLSYYRLQSGR